MEFSQFSHEHKHLPNITEFRHSFSTFPQHLREWMQSKDFLEPPSRKRASHAHKADPTLMKRLQELEEMDKLGDKTTFHGQYIVSRKDSENLDNCIDKLDAALLYYKESKLKLRLEAAKSVDASDVMDSRHIVIVGGGPSGMMCAIEAAILGHHVEVVESRPAAVRARAIGLYPETMVTLCRIGAPESMFNDNFLWCDKAGVTIFDLEFALTQIALKLGVTLYRNASAIADTALMADGILKVKQCSASGKTVYSEGDPLSLVLLRHATVLPLATEEFELNFDTIINCEGSAGRRFSEALVGDKAKASAKTYLTAADALAVHGAEREVYLTGTDDHIDKVITEVNWSEFTKALREGTVPAEVQCFVCNMPRHVFRKGPKGDGSGDWEVPHLMPKCPDDWLLIPIPPNRRESVQLLDGKQTDSSTSKGQLNAVASSTKDGSAKNLAATFGLEDKLIDRIQFEGIFPATMTEGLKTKVPFNVYRALLQALETNDVIDEAGLQKFFDQENSFPSAAQNACSVFLTAPVCHRTEQAIMSLPENKRQYAQCVYGLVPGSSKHNDFEYYIIGDALHSAWYRWGVGVLDAIHQAKWFGQSLVLPNRELRSKHMRKLEERFAKRAVHTSAYFYHINEMLIKDACMNRFSKEVESIAANGFTPAKREGIERKITVALTHW